MSRIKVNSQGSYFEKDGRSFFLMSDTDWMAFQKLSVEEFEQITALRKHQGFNAMQISVLPVTHDNAVSNRDMHPFHVVEGKYQFDRINEEYFDKASAMLEVMKKYEMIPFLHLFWCNYIPDTWAAKLSPDTVIPFEYIKPLTVYFVKRFDCFEPIYSVSGDTAFETDRVTEYYLEILNTLYTVAPGSLTTMHLSPLGDPPAVLRQHPQYHFYSYQASHSLSEQEATSHQTNMLKLSALFCGKAEKKPIVDTEPCYEGHGYAYAYGRFKAFDIRHATWQSLLSGASAGITYGAHGIWQFFRDGDVFKSCDFSSQPFNWHAALTFEGAWDVGFAKWLFERYDMFGVAPCTDIEARGNTVRMAEKNGLIVIYAPHPDEFSVLRDLNGYMFEAIGLETRKTFIPFTEIQDGKTQIHMPYLNEDILIIARK